MKRLFAAAWLLASAGTLCASINPAPRAVFRAKYALASNGRVQLHNLYGNVRIVAWDRDEVEVVATKCADEEGGLDDVQIVVEAGSAGVSIRTAYIGFGRQTASVEYQIMVPRGATLENVKLGNGGLSLSGLSGPVHASSVNGSIHAERMRGQVELSTVNGELEAGFQNVSDGHPISLTSVNGPIRLSLPQNAAVSVSADNRSGGIDADFARSWRDRDGNRLEATMNGGGASVRLHNVNGGISIHSVWERRQGKPIS
jgi:DUF4097 and DUF4098 domain-containing protein YvlB